MSFSKTLLVAAFASTIGACAAGGIKAEVGYLAASPSPNTTRMKVAEPLTIVVAAEIQDAFEVKPAPSMGTTYSGYRKSLGDALVKTFAANFSQVSIADKESGRGLELVLSKAQMRTTTTIQYQAVLLSDGKEVIDTAGATEGRAIAMGASVFNASQAYTEAMTTLSREAIEKMCSAIYDDILRSGHTKPSDFWDKKVAAAH